MIREVAETKCGSREKLESAMARGDVKKKTSRSGIDMYFFPSETHGEEEDNNEEHVISSKVKPLSDDNYKVLCGALDTVGWLAPSQEHDTQLAIENGFSCVYSPVLFAS